MAKKLLFLVTNDDGIHAPGLKVLFKRLHAVGRVVVVAPETERSAVAHAINIATPLRARKVTLAGGLQGYACSGTPVDCVKLAVRSLLRRKPDFVVSGVNSGFNLGMDILYSGTVAAALEGAILDIPSIAVSTSGVSEKHFSTAAEAAIHVMELLRERGVGDSVAFNINVPAVETAALRGYRFTRQGRGRFHEDYEERTDPRGQSYYWLTGSVPNGPSEPESDIAAVAEGFVSVTPLSLDMTHHRLVRDLS